MKGVFKVVATDLNGTEHVFTIAPWSKPVIADGGWFTFETDSPDMTIWLSSTFFTTVAFLSEREYDGIKQGQGDTG